MSNNLSPAVQAQYDSGHFAHTLLVKLEIPNHHVGFHSGQRDYPDPYTGFVYRANQFLNIDELAESLSNNSGQRKMSFSNIPIASGDIISSLEDYNYRNAKVIVSRLVYDPNTYEFKGFESVKTYTIYDVDYVDGAIQEDGSFTSTINITLRTTGFLGRNKNYSQRTIAEHQADIDATDTCYEHITHTQTVRKEFGRRSA